MIGARPRDLVLVVAALLTLAGVARASIVHFVGQGDSVTSLALEYYDDASKAAVIRAANSWPPEGEVELFVGEPVVIPECVRRVVEKGQTWQDLAREELGSAERAWLLAEANHGNLQEPPEPGRIVAVPFLLPVVLQEGLRATVKGLYPELSRSERRDRVRLIKRLNPDLPAQRDGRGARALLPFFDLTIRPTKRTVLEERQARHRAPRDQDGQRAASGELERLPQLLGDGSYIEVVVVASRVAGSTELTEAQQVTLHRYLGQAFVALDRVDLAIVEFEALLELQPDFQFDQVTTSPAVIEVLERARQRLRARGSPISDDEQP